MVTNAPFLTETTFAHKGTKTCLIIFISHFDEGNKTISVCSSETHKKGIFFGDNGADELGSGGGESATLKPYYK